MAQVFSEEEKREIEAQPLPEQMKSILEKFARQAARRIREQPEKMAELLDQIERIEEKAGGDFFLFDPRDIGAPLLCNEVRCAVKLAANVAVNSEMDPFWFQLWTNDILDAIEDELTKPA